MDARSRSWEKRECTATNNTLRTPSYSRIFLFWYGFNLTWVRVTWHWFRNQFQYNLVLDQEVATEQIFFLVLLLRDHEILTVLSTGSATKYCSSFTFWTHCDAKNNVVNLEGKWCSLWVSRTNDSPRSAQKTLFARKYCCVLRGI